MISFYTCIRRNKVTGILLLLFCIVLFSGFSGPVMAAEKLKPKPVPAAGTSSQRFITIDFDKVDILLFIKYISELTGKNFIIDKAVKGTVSIISPTQISEDDAYQVFESVLMVNGFTTVKAGVMTKIMSSVKARSENVDTLNHGRPTTPEDKIVTQLIPLTYTTPSEMKKVLTPLVSKTSVVIAHTQSGIMIVTDTLSNIQKLLSIIKALDVDRSNGELEVVLLEYATSSTIATTINAIFKRVAPPKKGVPAAISGVTVVPYDRINALIVMASIGDMLRVKRLIAMLDTAPEQDEGNIQVVYLQHARAKDLASVLTSLPNAKDKGVKGAQRTPSISEDVKIMADEETNSLIITASRSEFKALKNVINKLDIPRRMVYLEALILEVNTDASFEVGVKWIGAGSYSDETGGVLGGWGGSNSFSTGDVITATADGGAAVGHGFTLGVLQKGIQIGGVSFPNIAAILNAYKSDSRINIIATPQILTTDNKKAEISVGENRPYLTKTSEANSGTGYQNYEYKDIATKLTITPQINQANTLRLEISTEVSKLNANASEVDRPVTYKRTANTTVLVQDNETIVIGGIIGHDATESEWKVPLLGDIPLLGWLFKSHSTNHLKTNMFVFITPHIIKNPADIAAMTMLKEEQMDKVMPAVKNELHRQVSLDHALTLADIGFQKLQEKKFLSAKQYFEKALEINPSSPYVLMNLGVVAEKQGDDVVAVEYYQRVLDNGDEELVGPDGMDVQNICEERIQRISEKSDTWPYPENE